MFGINLMVPKIYIIRISENKSDNHLLRASILIVQPINVYVIVFKMTSNLSVTS